MEQSQINDVLVKLDGQRTIDLASSNGQLAVSVIIPSYNEKATILEILRRVKLEASVHEIIVVDDGSTDGTQQLLVEVEKEIV